VALQAAFKKEDFLIVTVVVHTQTEELHALWFLWVLLEKYSGSG